MSVTHWKYLQRGNIYAPRAELRNKKTELNKQDRFLLLLLLCAAPLSASYASACPWLSEKPQRAFGNR